MNFTLKGEKMNGGYCVSGSADDCTKEEFENFMNIIKNQIMGVKNPEHHNEHNYNNKYDDYDENYGEYNDDYNYDYDDDWIDLIFL